MQYVYFNLLMKEKKGRFDKKNKKNTSAHLILPAGVCHIEVWLWYSLFFEQYLSTFSVMLSSFNNGEVSRVSVFCFEFTNMDHILFLTVYIFFVCFYTF